MDVCQKSNPYASMSIPQVDMSLGDAQKLAELQARESQAMSQHLSVEGLMVMIRDNDRAEAAKLGLRRDSASCVHMLANSSQVTSSSDRRFLGVHCAYSPAFALTVYSDSIRKIA
ncbi:hypothetical protein JCM16303_000240 [Sporobolomyces ruberrimus]